MSDQPEPGQVWRRTGDRKTYAVHSISWDGYVCLLPRDPGSRFTAVKLASFLARYEQVEAVDG